MEVYRLPDWVENDYDLELYHHGVKGMKWGVRKDSYKQRVNNKIDSDYKERKNRMSRKDSAEITLRKESRKNSLKLIGGMLGGAGGTMGTIGQVGYAATKAARATAAAKSAAFAAQSAKFMAGKATFGSVAAATGKVAAVSALSFLNPVTLAATGTLAAVGVGLAAANVYKQYKLNEIHDEEQIPNAKRQRLV